MKAHDGRKWRCFYQSERDVFARIWKAAKAMRARQFEPDAVAVLRHEGRKTHEFVASRCCQKLSPDRVRKRMPRERNICPFFATHRKSYVGGLKLHFLLNQLCLGYEASRA